VPWRTEIGEVAAASELPILAVLVGAALLLLGRRLYLFFVLCAGLYAGLWVTTRLGIGGPPWLGLAVALLLGVAGAALALVAQRLAVAVAGFLVGGTLAFTVLDAQGVSLEGGAWLVPLVAAAVAAMLALALFDTALVVLSSLLGAALLVDASGAAGVPALVLFVVLLTVGVAMQGRSLRPSRKRAESTS
jgi:hypothetical protein